MQDTSDIRLPDLVRLKLSSRTVSDLASLDALQPDWLRLEQQSQSAIFFQSFDWCRYIWQTRSLSPAGDLQCAPSMRVVVVEDAGSIVAIWPLAVFSATGCRIAHDLSEPFGQYSDIIVAQAADVDAVMEVALAEVASWHIDGVILRKVRVDAALGGWLEKRGVRIGPSEMAPAVELSAFDSFDAYRRSINAKTRKNLRNYRNRLMRDGQLDHHVFEDTDTRARVIESCFIGRSDWLENSGRTSTAFVDPLFSTIVTGLARGDRLAPPVVAMRLGLSHGVGSDETISVHWGFVHRGRYYAYMAARNPDYDAVSPGRLHLEDVISACADRGVGTVDLLAPAMPYKSTWATQSVAVNAYGLGLTAKGKFLTHVWYGIARPALKRVMDMLPPAIRRLAFRTCGSRPNHRN